LLCQTFAQEQNAAAPQVREEIEAVFKKFQEAYNEHGAAAVAACDFSRRD
jgi:hypothetical protein